MLNETREPGGQPDEEREEEGGLFTVEGSFPETDEELGKRLGPDVKNNVLRRVITNIENALRSVLSTWDMGIIEEVHLLEAQNGLEELINLIKSNFRESGGDLMAELNQAKEDLGRADNESKDSYLGIARRIKEALKKAISFYNQKAN